MNVESLALGPNRDEPTPGVGADSQRIKRSTVVDLVVESLRNRILSGELAAGSPLRQEALGEQLGVSRIPVREAINRLEAEGFVTVVPHKGAFVTHMSIEEVSEAFNVRLRIEPWVFGQAIEKITRDDLAHIRQFLVPDMSRILSVDWGKMNWKFHEALYAPARQPLTLNILQRLHELTDRYFRFQVTNVDIRPTANDEHNDLVEAAAAGQAQYGMKLLENHIRVAADQITSKLPR